MHDSNKVIDKFEQGRCQQVLATSQASTYNLVSNNLLLLTTHPVMHNSNKVVDKFQTAKKYKQETFYQLTVLVTY